jgi:hypothetical protein
MSRWITFDDETAEVLRSNLDAVAETRAGDALQAAVESQNAVVLLPAGDNGVLLVRLQRRRDLPIESPSEQVVPEIKRRSATTNEPVSAVLEMDRGHSATIEAVPQAEAPLPHDEWIEQDERTEQDATPLPDKHPWYEAPLETEVDTRPHEEWSYDRAVEDPEVSDEVVPHLEAAPEHSNSEPDDMRFAAGGLLGLRDEPVYEEEKPKKWWQRILE